MSTVRPVLATIRRKLKYPNMLHHLRRVHAGKYLLDGVYEALSLNGRHTTHAERAIKRGNRQLWLAIASGIIRVPLPAQL